MPRAVGRNARDDDGSGRRRAAGAVAAVLGSAVGTRTRRGGRRAESALVARPAAAAAGAGTVACRSTRRGPVRRVADATGARADGAAVADADDNCHGAT